MTESLLSTTTPEVSVAGQARDELGRDLLHLEVAESTDGLRTLTMRLLAFGPRAGEPEEGILYLDRAPLDFGAEIEVKLGPEDGRSSVFKGKLSAIQADFEEAAEPQVLVYAEDRLMDLRMTRRMRTYEQVSDADIARTVAGEHGLSPAVDADGPTYDVVHQWNMSDLAFLRHRADRVQAEVWVDGSTLHFKARGKRSGSSLTLVQGNELVCVQLRADLAHQRTKVVVSGYDASQRDAVDEEAEGSAVQSEATGGETGPAVLQQAFGARASYRVLDVPLLAAEARDWAKAEMLRRARGFVTASGVTRGSPTLAVGSKLKLEEVGPPFSGDGYYVTHVRHTWDTKSGYRTHFEAERASVGAGGG